MLYTDRFISTDNLIVHLRTVVGTIADPAIQANYAGFLSVSCVTVYELAIKDVLIEFATKKNKVFGSFVEQHFKRLNGKITLDNLRDLHIILFGQKYLDKFNAKLDKKEDDVFAVTRSSVKTMYANLITCRHKFVHTGNPTLTINEVMSYYVYKSRHHLTVNF